MGRLGVLLIFLSVVVMIGGLVVPMFPEMDSLGTVSLLETLLCGSGEKLEREQFNYSVAPGESGVSTTLYCVGYEQREEVTGTWIVLVIAGFMIPFFIGLMMTIGGTARRSGRLVTQASGGLVDIQMGTIPKVKVSGMDLSDFINTAMTGTRVEDGGSLKDRLKELKEAHDAGLISEEEYTRLRQEILDALA